MLVGKTSKANSETKRLIVDFGEWVDSGETIISVTAPVIEIDAEAWVGPWPPPNVIVNNTPVIPDDTDPLLVSSTQIVGGRYVYIFVTNGTVGITYSVTFTATGDNSGRTKEARVDVSTVNSGGRTV